MSQHIQNSLVKGRIQLSKKQLFFHYFFALFLPLSVLLIMEITFVLAGSEQATQDFYRRTVLIFSGMFSFWYLIRQYNSLRLTFVPASISEEEFENRLKNIALENHWILEETGEGYRVFTTHFRWNNWGTLIHVIHAEDAVCFNSICDLYNRPSTVSFGINAKNREALLKAFEAN